MTTLICNCNQTLPLQTQALGRALGEELKEHTTLCRREAGAFQRAAQGREAVVVAKDRSVLGDAAEEISMHFSEKAEEREHDEREVRVPPHPQVMQVERIRHYLETARALDDPAKLALLASGWPEWSYAYAQPADALNIIAVLPPNSSDDYSSGVPDSAGGPYVPQPFSCEINETGASVIYTDQADAVLRYSASVSDPTRFSPGARVRNTASQDVAELIGKLKADGIKALAEALDPDRHALHRGQRSVPHSESTEDGSEA